MMPGSFLVPGTNTSFRLRGFVRLAALYDLEPIGIPDAFVPNTIPVPQQSGQNFNMSARISRFAPESWTPTDFCDWNVHTFIEGDFFNGPAQAAGGGGNPFRLRHAFFDFGYFRFGQQNSVFMDGSNWPSLVDFQGPNGWINQRQPSARMTLPIADRCVLGHERRTPVLGHHHQRPGHRRAGCSRLRDAPALRGRSGPPASRRACCARSATSRPATNVTRRMGAGISGSLVFHPWAILMGTDPVREEDPSGLTRSRILLQCTWGPGIGRYVNDLVGQGLDGQVDPITGDFDLVERNGLERQLRTLVQRALALELHLFAGHCRQQPRSAGHDLRQGAIPGGQPVVDSGHADVVRHRVHVGRARESRRRSTPGPSGSAGFSSTTSNGRSPRTYVANVAERARHFWAERHISGRIDFRLERSAWYGIRSLA